MEKKILPHLALGSATEMLKNINKQQKERKFRDDPYSMTLRSNRQEDLSKGMTIGMPSTKEGRTLENVELSNAWNELKTFEPKDFIPMKNIKSRITKDFKFLSAGAAFVKKKFSDKFGRKLTPGEEMVKRMKETDKDITSFKEEKGEIATVKTAVKEIAQNPLQLIPFLSGVSEAATLAPILFSASKIKDGTASEEDVDNVKSWYDKEVAKSKRIQTPGYKITNILKGVPSFAGELALTGGLATAAKKATIKTGKEFLESLLKKGGKELLEASLKKTAKKSLKKKAIGFGFETVGTVAGELARTPVSGITRIPASAIDKMLPKEIDTGSDDLDKIILKEGDNAFDAFKKATGEQLVENLSEQAGGIFENIKVPKLVKDKLIKNSFVKAFLKLNPKTKAAPALQKLWRKAGWNGIVGEFAEERIGEVGHAVFNKAGLSDQKYQFPTMEDMAIELAAFSIMGTGMKALERSEPSIGMSIKDVSGINPYLGELVTQSKKSKLTKDQFVIKINEGLASKDAEKRKNAEQAVTMIRDEVKTTPEVFFDEYIEVTKREKPTLDKKIELTEEFDVNEPTSNKYKQAEHESDVLSRLEIAEKGERVIIKKEDGTTETVAKASTFPGFIPEGLRSKVLVDKVLEHINKGTIPEKANEVRLYNVVAEEMSMTPQVSLDSGKKIDVEALDFEANYVENVGEESIDNNDVREFVKSKKPMSFIEDYLEKNDLPLTSFDSVRAGFQKKAESLKDEKGFLFYSPNIEENLNIDEATRALNSNRHANIKQRANEIDQQLSLSAKTYDAVGTWADGAENSIWQEFTGIDNIEDLMYSSALKGKLSNQKAVLVFKTEKGGKDTLFTVKIPSKDLTIKELSERIEKEKLENKTIRETKEGYEVSIFDEGSKDLDKLTNITKKYGYAIEQRKGEGNFLGSWETRAEGLKEYNKAISEYKSKRRDSRRDGERGKRGESLRVPTRVETKKQDNLIEEAKKYDTVDEFIEKKKVEKLTPSKVERAIKPLAPKVETKAIGDVTGRKKKLIDTKRREDILLRAKSRAERKIAVAGAVAGARVEKAKQKRVIKEKVETVKRKGSLERLKQRVIDRDKAKSKKDRAIRVTAERIVDIRRKTTLDKLKQRIKDRDKLSKQKSKTESIKSMMNQMKGIRNGIITYAKRYLPKEIRGKVLTKSLMNTKKIETLKAAIRKIDVWAKLNREAVLRADIFSSLKQTKIKRKFGKPVGKFTADVQQMLEAYREATKLTKEAAQEKIESNIDKHTASSPINIALQNRILDVASGIKEMKEKELSELLFNINSLKETGKVEKSLQDLDRKEETEKIINEVIDSVTGGKGIDPKTDTVGVQDPKTLKEKARRYFMTLGKSIVGWQDVLDMLSSKDKKSKSGESALNKFGETLQEENSFNSKSKKKSEEAIQLVKDAYGLKTDKEVFKKNREDSIRHNLGTFKNKAGVVIDLELSKAEARKKYAELQDAKLKEAMMNEEGMAYTQEMVDVIENSMSKEDKKFVDGLFNFYNSFYTEINKVYRKMFGVDLPFLSKYTPVKRADITNEIEDMAPGASVKALYSLSKAPLKSRVKSMKRIETKSDVEALLEHITEMQHFASWASKNRKFNAVFGNAKVRTAINQEYGKGMISLLDNFRQDFARGGIDHSKRMAAVSKYMGNFSRAVLAIKPLIMIKQLTSFVAFADNIPVSEFARGTAKFWSDPVKHWKELSENSDLLETRGSNIDRDLKAATKTEAHRKFMKNKSFLNTLMLNVMLGDRAAIIAGGYPVYDYYKRKALKEGKTEKEAKKIAIEKFEKASKTTQQSAAIADLSQWQRGGTFARIFSMFKSSPNQYLRKEISAIRGLITGRSSVKQVAKTLAIYHFILPMMFQYISDGFRWDEEEQKRASILGSLNGIFLVGDGIEYIIRSALGMRTFALQTPIMSTFGEIGDAVKLVLAEDDMTVEDVEKAIKLLSSATGKVTGVPTEYAFKGYEGSKKAFTGEYTQALGMLAGWSKYKVEKKSDEMKAKKRKKARKPEFEGLDLENLDLKNLEDFDLEDLDLEDFDIAELDFEDIDFEDTDFDDTDFDIEDLDFGDFDISDLDI